MWGERRNEEEEEVKGFFRNLVMEDSAVSATFLSPFTVRSNLSIGPLSPSSISSTCP